MIFQEGTPDSIKLLPNPNEAVVDKLATDLGLQKVGWIFTDLVADDVRKGTVKHLRDINTFFLTAEECILAAHLQNLHPSPCILSSNGKFGSKFSTVVVSGLFVQCIQCVILFSFVQSIVMLMVSVNFGSSFMSFQ